MRTLISFQVSIVNLWLGSGNQSSYGSTSNYRLKDLTDVESLCGALKTLRVIKVSCGLLIYLSIMLVRSVPGGPKTLRML